jgi:hypothetical protein
MKKRRFILYKTNAGYLHYFYANEGLGQGNDKTISAKKPDEWRRWMRRFFKINDIPPVRDLKKTGGYE